MNCSFTPTPSVSVNGETRIACRVVDVTVTVAVAVRDPTVAVMVTPEPADAPVSKPAASTDATDEAEELHVAEVVTSRVLPLLKVPSTVSCCVVLTGSETVEGLIEIPVRLGELITVRIVVPDTLPTVAVIVVLPKLTPVAVEPLIVATEVAEDVHVAAPVMSCELPSL